MIIVDELSKSYLSVTFNYSKTYVGLMRQIRKQVSDVMYNKKYNLWKVPKSGVDVLEEVIGDRVLWKTPKWKIFNLAKPDYKDLYEVDDYDLPELNNDISLFNYQEYTARFMIDRLLNHGFVINSMSVGLGKSPTTISVYQWLKDNKDVKKGVIICPSTLKVQWQEEVIDTFIQEKSIILDGSKNKRKEILQEFAQMDEGLLIMNPHLLLHDLDDLLQIQIDFIALDEAQNLKARTGKMNNSLMKLVAKDKKAIQAIKTPNSSLNSKVSNWTKRIEYLAMLTATPIKSHPDNLYGLMQLRDKAILGSWREFEKEYMDYEYSGRFKKHIGYRNLHKLKGVADKYTIRLTEHEVDLELPEVTPKMIKLNQDATQKKMFKEAEAHKSEALNKYEKIRNSNASSEDKEKAYGSVMVVSMCEFAIADDPRLVRLSKSAYIKKRYVPLIPKTYKMSPKTQALLELLDGVFDASEKAIVFTIFERMTRILKDDIEKTFKGVKVSIISGEQTDEENEQAKSDFKFDADTKVLVLTEKGHEGINLQNANNVVHYDLPKTQDGVLQRRGRARRVGSKHTHIAEFFLLTKDSKDMVRYEKLKGQKFMSDGVLVADDSQREEIKNKIGE